jgi:hypothetical protein
MRRRAARAAPRLNAAAPLHSTLIPETGHQHRSKGCTYRQAGAGALWYGSSGQSIPIRGCGRPHCTSTRARVSRAPPFCPAQHTLAMALSARSATLENEPDPPQPRPAAPPPIASASWPQQAPIARLSRCRARPRGAPIAGAFGPPAPCKARPLTERAGGGAGGGGRESVIALRAAAPATPPTARSRAAGGGRGRAQGTAAAPGGAIPRRVAVGLLPGAVGLLPRCPRPRGQRAFDDETDPPTAVTPY